MPAAYQKRRTQEIKQRDERLKAKEIPKLAEPEPVENEAEKKSPYEIGVRESDCTRYWPEAKFREKWPAIYHKMGMRLDELETYILRHRRLLTVAPAHVPQVRSPRFYMG